MALLRRSVMRQHRRAIVRAHGSGRRRRIVVLVLTGDGAQSLQAMRGIRRVRRLSELPGKIAIARIPARIEGHAIVSHPIIHMAHAEVPRHILIIVGIVGGDESQLLRDGDPDAVAAESLLVAVEVLQALARHRVAVHGRVLLMAEGDAGAGDALAAGLGALRADGALLAALELWRDMVSIALRCSMVLKPCNVVNGRLADRIPSSDGK